MARLILNPAAVHKAADEPAKKLVAKVVRDTRISAEALIPKKTGRTARRFGQSIRTVPGDGVFAELWNSSEVGWWLHEGTPAHPEPIYRKGPMHFYWERKGHWVTLAKVHHPGIKPVRYLTNPLKVFGKSNGFKVTTHLVGPGSG